MRLGFVTAFLFVFLTAYGVSASPIKTVGSAGVKKGAHKIEWRSGWSADGKDDGQDNRLQLRQYYDYGVTDLYALRLTLIQDDAGKSDLEHNAIGFDSRFHVFKKETHGFDGGFRIAYTLRDGDKKPDAIETRWINQFYWRDFEFRHHIILQHQVGQQSRSGIRPELRWQVTHPIYGKHRAGVELFNEFGNLRDQDGFDSHGHDAGIVFTGPIANGFRYQTGYRHGISDAAPDHAFKFFIGYDF